MAEVFVEFSQPVVAPNGARYIARACGSELDKSRWQGWIEFVPLDGGEVLRSGRETTQPNRTDAEYWATGLTPVFLEGSLERTLKPLVRRTPAPIAPPAYDAPAPRSATRAPAAESILNPFSVYRKGEAMLRDQLAALSPRHLVNIIRAHQLSAVGDEELNRMTGAQLVELIAANVRVRAGESVVD
jgi:hypothetical protein